jgi:hypothetical protein
MNAKDFALIKTTEIIQLTDDLKYINNKELRMEGLNRIEELARGIEEHLEYLDIKEVKDE